MNKKDLLLCVDFYKSCEECPSKIMCPDAGKSREEILKLAIKKSNIDKKEKN